MMRQATFPLLFVLSPNLQADPAAAIERTERKIRRAALRREPVLLGTVAAPYEPARETSPLAALRSVGDGLKVAITTASPRIAGEVELLADLDRRHSVTVRMIAPLPSVFDPGPRLRAAQTLASEGITTFLLIAPASPASLPNEAAPNEADLRRLFAAAREAEIHDVEIATGNLRRLARDQRDDWADTLRQLRWEYGFPQRTAGRG
jgi:DNA repair photolyase